MGLVGKSLPRWSHLLKVIVVGWQIDEDNILLVVTSASLTLHLLGNMLRLYGNKLFIFMSLVNLAKQLSNVLLTDMEHIHTKNKYECLWPCHHVQNSNLNSSNFIIHRYCMWNHNKVKFCTHTLIKTHVCIFMNLPKLLMHWYVFLFFKTIFKKILF